VIRESARRRAAGERAAAPLVVRLEPAGAAPALDELFRFRFAGTAADGAGEGVFPLHLEPLGGAPLDEAWCTAGEIGGGELGNLRFRQSRDHLAVHLRLDPPAARPLDEVAHGAYRQLISFARRRGYEHLLRVWNLFPDINSGEGDGERYRVFSAGRAVALDAFGYRDRRLPAGTAIGTEPGTPLTITLLAAAAPRRAVENPRQTSAYCYPRRFGPRSPSFSRAVLLRTGGARQLLVSGTASIVGYESLHGGSLAGQIAETFRNIRALCRQAQIDCDGAGGGTAVASLRMYLRRREDFEAASSLLPDCLESGERVICLRGDICRRELVLEVEGAYRF
jgi:chorismate lyase/3-hydroxybenzoate synthase